MSEAREPEEIARACARQVRGCATDEQYKAVFAAIAAAIAAERALVAELVEALKGVIRVADRATIEFDAARAALTRAGASHE